MLSAAIAVRTSQRIDWTLLRAFGSVEQVHVLFAAASSRRSMIVILHIELDSTEFYNISTSELVVLKKEFPI